MFWGEYFLGEQLFLWSQLTFMTQLEKVIIFRYTFRHSPPGVFAGCWGGCSLVNNIFKYFHIFSNISWESPPGMYALCWGGCSLVNNIKGREVEKQTGWMQKTRSQLLRHMFQMESLLLFPPVLRQRFRAGRQFLKGKISLESKNADGKMSFNKDSVFVHVLTNEILNQPPSPIAFKRHSAK